MQDLKIGHFTSLDRGTGISVFLFDKPAIGAYQICGASPATRELPVLAVDSNVPELHGLVLTGGSAFGLGAVDGVMRFLLERNQGKPMPHGGVVPIVPAAAIYDLAVTSALPPTAEEAYQACVAAKEYDTTQGRIGAGTGASVGKIIPQTARMSGGVGHATIKLPSGVEVTAYAVVNAVGDVRDAAGNIIAGARKSNGAFADCQQFLLSGHTDQPVTEINTTLVAVFTNAAFSKIELQRIAKMAVAGFARAISPIFTQYDGDIVFCVSMGDHDASELMVGALAAEVVRGAIVNAVKESIIL